MAECEWDGCTYGGLYSASHLKGRQFCILHREEMVRIYLHEQNAKAQRIAARTTREAMFKERRPDIYEGRHDEEH